MGLMLAQAGTATGEPVSLGEVHVVGESDARGIGRLSSSQMTVVPVAQARQGGEGIPDLLSKVAGVQVKHYGGLEDFSLVSIRGTSPTHTRFYLDGLPLPQSANGFVNLAALPLSQIERMEVYKGAPPIRFLDAPIGGAVNLVSKKVPRRLNLGGEVGYGSYQTVHAQADYGQFFTRSGFRLGVGYRRTAGDFPFLDDNGTPFNLNDDAVVTRRNNDSEDISLHGAYETKQDWGQVDLSSDFLSKHSGVPGLGSFQSSSARFDSWQHLLHARYRHPLGGEQGSTESTLFYGLEQDTFKDLNGEIGLARQHNKNRSLNLGAMERVTYRVGKNLLEANVRLVWDLFAPTDQLSGMDLPNHHRTSLQWGLQDEIGFWEDKLTVVPSVRLEEDFSPGKFNYAPGLRVRFAPFDFLYFKLGVARGFRIPTFFELFGDRGSTAGNPNLLPETSWDFDGAAGLVIREQGILDELALEVAPFQIFADQLIIFEQNSQRTVVARNASSTRIRGMELVFDLGLLRHFRFNANYTYQRAVDTSDIPFLNGKLLPGRPLHEVYLRPEFSWTLPRDIPLKVFYEGNFTGRNFLDRANLTPVGVRIIHNAGFSIKPSQATTVVFEAKNLSNNQVVDAIGFPLPGRSYFGSVNVSFNKEKTHEKRN